MRVVQNTIIQTSLTAVVIIRLFAIVICIFSYVKLIKQHVFFFIFFLQFQLHSWCLSSITSSQQLCFATSHFHRQFYLQPNFTFVFTTLFLFPLLLPKHFSSCHTIFGRSCLSEVISSSSSTCTRPATQNPGKYEMLSCPRNLTAHHRHHKTSIEN